MKWLWRSLLVLVLLGGGFWLWRSLHPGTEKIIRDRLDQLARQVSFQSDETDLVRLGKLSSITGFFAPEVELKLNFREVQLRRTFDLEMIQTGVLGLRTEQPQGITIDFVDTTITLPAGGEFATAELTMKASTPGERDFNMQEMKFALHRQGDRWLIYRVETVRTLK